MDNEKLATELLHELKVSCSRWFYAFIVVLVLWFGTIAAFLWYISLPVEEETVTVDNESGNTAYIGNDMTGDFNYGQDNSEEETSEQ